MKLIVSTLTFVTAALTIANAQTQKVTFEIDGEEFISLRQNAGGFNYINHDGTQSSTFFGYLCGLNNTSSPSLFNSGEFNTAFGYLTLTNNTTAQGNTAFGALALGDNETGNSNTAVGFSALRAGVSAQDNVGVGKSALRSNVEGNFNVAIGNDAFNNTEFASQSVAIGATAGVNDTSSVDNVYLGFGAGRGTVSATDGYNRSDNTIIGSRAGYFNSTSGNVFIGHEAGINAAADNQLYITNSDTDSLNTLIYGQFDNELLRLNAEVNIDGLYTLPTTTPTTGDVLRYNGGSNLEWSGIDAPWTVGEGDDVLYEDGDVGIGIGNAIYRIDVQDNVSNGYVARFRNSNTSTSSKGIIIQTGPNVNPNSSVYYALFLDGNGTNIGGIRGNGSGGTLFSTTSDRRLKQHIRPFDSGLDLIAQIQPSIYEMKSNPGVEEIGFIAQELQSVMPQAVGGHPSDDPETSPMTVDYSRVTPILVAAIKEQQQMIEELTKRLDDQNEELSRVKAAMVQLQAAEQTD